MKYFCTKEHKPKSFAQSMDLSLGLQRANIKSSNMLKNYRQNSNKRNIKTFTFGADGIKLAGIDYRSKKPKHNNWGFKKKDISKIICYNCDKKSYYIRNCLKPKKFFK